MLVSTVADVISIHAAREGGDVYITCLINVVCISIHAAREGGDDGSGIFRNDIIQFQSTPPVKAATAETNRRNQHFRKQQV